MSIAEGFGSPDDLRAQVLGLRAEVEALRADRDRLAADLEVARVALALALDDLDEWVACKASLEAAGFNMDDTAERADSVRAALVRIAKEADHG